MKKKNITRKLSLKKNNIALIDSANVKGGSGNCITILACFTKVSCTPKGCGNTLVVC